MKIEYIFRSLFRHRLNSAIIIISLAIGIACMNLIVVFVTREYNVDGFLKNKNRIYALQTNFNKKEKFYFVYPGVAEYMKANFAEVKDFCRITNEKFLSGIPSKVTANHHDYFDQPNIMAASSNFFEFFSYNLILGKPQNVLKSKQDIVISQTLAHKYFGSSDPIGKKITLVNRKGSEQLFVTGVFKRPLESSNLHFDMMIMLPPKEANRNGSFQCYLLLAKHTNIKQLEHNFFQNRASIPNRYNRKSITYTLNNLRDTYFDSSNGQINRHKSDLIIALVIAFLILGIALFNYLGLTNNRLMEKTKEYAIRRINGSSKTDLVARFMAETFALVGISFLLSFLLIVWAIPFFNKLTSSTLTTSYILELRSILLMATIPALVLVATYLFALAQIKKNMVVEGLNPLYFRPTGKMNFPTFNVIQLTISVILTIASFIISKQTNYIANKNIGLDKHVLEVRIPARYKNLAPVFKSELEKQPAVKIVSIGMPIFIRMAQVTLSYDEMGRKKQYAAFLFGGDQNYVKTLGIKIIKGKGFSKESEANKYKCLINESLARLFRGRHIIGHELPGLKTMTVIGIVKDFNYATVKYSITPVIISCGSMSSFNPYLMIKPKKGKLAQTRKFISQTWNKLIPDFPVNMVSTGDRFEWMNRKSKNYAELIGACCLISIFLSMIGLFAVAFQSSQYRTKEIGIRKVNGATIFEIIYLLTQDIAKWAIIAFIVAVPVAYYFMHRWLQNFAYKTSLSWWIFVLAGIFVLIIAMATVSWQTFIAARKNPVESLRYE